ncbi:Splicing factor 3A subunit 2 [Dermatophagoides farinae]|uniref:Splicing factor 3A subunit 2 n=1 Tax=Dermatophagoides farinae TaxID=6954 RepID=A0A922I8N4_DERFA|nr:Splicing factor 3A subunit 2 [Dermatophagoides farinae]
MDFQHRPGAKTGGGGVASWSETNRDRRERLRQLALETIDLAKDPYFMKNHLGSYECKLCLTLHNNEGSYLAHTQGKKHQSNLARRAAKDAKDAPQPMLSKSRIDIRKFVKIGRPGYRVTKQFDQENQQQSLLFQIDYPEISENIAPRHRFMSAYEQKIEPPDRHWQYLLFAAEPYETIGFKIPSREVDKAEGKFWTLWNRESKQFFLQFAFKVESKGSSLIHQNNILPSSSSSTSTSSTTTSTATIKSTVAGNQSSNNTTIESPSTTTSAASAAATAAGEIPKNNNDNQNGD